MVTSCSRRTGGNTRTNGKSMNAGIFLKKSLRKKQTASWRMSCAMSISWQLLWGVDLDNAVVLKFNEVSQRVGSEVFFDFA